jgi:hypothetical protein
MAAAFRGREEVLDELEAHLRDEVDRLMQAGQPLERAVQVAAARLGRPGELAAEFAKVPPPFSPWLPVRLAWVAIAVLAVSLLGGLAPRLTVGGPDALLAVHRGAVTLGYLATLAVGSLAVCFLLTRLFRDLEAGQRRSLQRAALLLSLLAAVLTGLGIAVGGLCPFEKTGWCFGLSTHEVAGVVVLLWDGLLLVTCFCGRSAGGLTAGMLLGVVGNVLVLLGWLGAAVVEDHPVGFLGGATILALVVSQLAIGCTAFAPAGCLRGKRP